MKRKAFLSLIVAFLIALNTMPVHAAEAGWKKDGTGWWYDNGDGTYAKNELKRIDGKYYGFDKNGYMLTGIQYVADGIHYFKDNGEMMSSEWYRVSAENWAWIDYFGERYTYHNNVDNKRYRLNKYSYWTGQPPRDSYWTQDSAGWHFVYELGLVRSELTEIDRKVYLFDENGTMLTDWQQVDGSWMYFGADGAMRQEEWIGNYWVDFYGKMATNSWVDNGKYYVGADGAWIPGYGKPQWKKDAYGWWYDNGDGTYPKGDFKTIGGETYYFDWNGYMLTGWQYILKEWHFFKPSGAMKRNEWEGDYWLDASGFMARGCWVDQGRYYVGDDGKWVPDAKKS